MFFESFSIYQNSALTRVEFIAPNTPVVIYDIYVVKIIFRFTLQRINVKFQTFV